MKRIIIQSIVGLALSLIINPALNGSMSVAESSSSSTATSSSSYAPIRKTKGWFIKNCTRTDLLIQRFILSNKMKTSSIKKQQNAFIDSYNDDDKNYPLIISRETEPKIDWPLWVSELPACCTEDDSKCERLIIQENEEKVGYDVISTSQDSWLVCNRTDYEDLYYAWYLVTTEPTKKSPTYTQLVIPQTVGKKGHCAPIYQPSNQEDICLAICSKKEDLQKRELTNNCLKISLSTLKKEFPRHELVITGDSGKILAAHSGIYLTVINTTGKALYCTLFNYDTSNNIFGSRFDHINHKIMPQMRTLVPLPAGESVRLVIAKKEPKVTDLNGKALGENIYVYPENIINQHCLLITTALATGQCPFAVKRFGEESTSILPYIFTSFVPAQRTFSPGSLAQIEQEITPPRKKKSTTNASKSYKEESVGKIAIAEITSLEKEQAFLKQRGKKVWAGIIILLGKDKLNDLLQKCIKECQVKNTDIKPLEHYLELPAPKIAFVSTGGGYRAMIETLGFLEGAEETGILDCCTYMCGLSGSTWAMTALVASGKTVKKFVIEQRAKVTITNPAQNYLIKKMGGGTLRQLMCDVASDTNYLRRTLIQSRFNQPQGVVGFYGHALTHRLLDGIELNGKTKHDITLSDLQAHLTEGEYPLPICVAVESAENTNKNLTHTWFEYSPYYVGTYLIGARSFFKYVDTENFGSFFLNDEIKQRSPEYPLAQLWGMWGSAFAVSANDIAARNASLGLVVKAIESFGNNAGYMYNTIFPDTNSAPKAAKSRFAVAQVPSFLYVSDDQTNSNPGISSKDKLDLIDGGIALVDDKTHNFATVPALMRDVDALILCDCTSEPNNVVNEHLDAAEREAANLGVDFPLVTKECKIKVNADTNVSVLITEEKKKDTKTKKETLKPSVVYIKGKQYFTGPNSTREPSFDPSATVNKNGVDEPTFTNTKNFSYTNEEYDKLRKLAHDIITLKGAENLNDYTLNTKAQEDIKKVVELAVERHFKKSMS